MTYPKSSRRPFAKWMVGVALLTGSGCLPHVAEQTTKTPFPSRSERAAASTSKREAEPTVTAEVSGNVVTVDVEQTTECQEQHHTPMEEETVTERHLENGGVAQAINLGSAALLVGTGLVFYAAGSGACSTTPDATPQNPNPTSRPCTADERSTAKSMGIVLSSSAVIPLGLFVWNIFRAKDERKIETRPPHDETTEWTACGSNPVSGANVTLSLGASKDEATLNAVTDAEGRASFDLSTVRSSSDRARLTVLASKGPVNAEVSLRGTPMRTAAAAQASNAAWERARQEQDEQHAAALDDAENRIKTLEQTKVPWGEGEIATMANLGVALVEYNLREETRARAAPLQARWLRLSDGPGKRAVALKQQRDRAAKEASQAEQRRKEQEEARFAATPRGQCVNMCAAAAEVRGSACISDLDCARAVKARFLECIAPCPPN